MTKNWVAEACLVSKLLVHETNTSIGGRCYKGIGIRDWSDGTNIQTGWRAIDKMKNGRVTRVEHQIDVRIQLGPGMTP